MAASAKLNVFADAVRDAIANGLPVGDETEVVRSFHPDVLGPDFDPRGIERRRVYVVPITRRQAAHNTRETDLNEYEVAVLVASRFTGKAGDPPDDWIDQEMYWQEQNVFERLGNERTASTPADVLATFAFCDKSDPQYAYDPEGLQAQRMFYSLQVFAFQRAE